MQDPPCSILFMLNKYSKCKLYLLGQERIVCLHKVVVFCNLGSIADPGMFTKGYGPIFCFQYWYRKQTFSAIQELLHILVALDIESDTFYCILNQCLLPQQVQGRSEYCGSRGRGVRRGMKRARVTLNLPTPTQSPHSMSPVANSSVFEASEEVPDTRGIILKYRSC